MENVPNLSFYPNPANDFLKVNYETIETAITGMHIFNYLGQLVGTVDKEQFAQLQTIKIDIREFPSGIYFFQLESKYIYTGKFIKF